MSFEGFPAAALDFYDDLEIDNSKRFWDNNKSVYADAVLAPMKALAAALEEEFGTAKIFRPHRDVRFAKDKSTLYKTHQGAFVAVAPETGYYVEVSARGIRTGGGCYWFSPERLAAFRTAVDHELSGPELEKLLTSVQKKGFELGGDQLRTKPRGFDADHPRIDLLRHKSITLGRVLGFDPVIHTADLADVIRGDWRSVRPVTEWIARNSQV